MQDIYDITLNFIAAFSSELFKVPPHISIHVILTVSPHLSVPQVTSQRMQGLLLLVFAKYFHLPFLRGVQTETTRTGLGGYWVRWLPTPYCDQRCVIMDISHMMEA